MSEKSLSTEKIFVTGHRNPDTDSICSAICYARLKQMQGFDGYVPCHPDTLNPESQFVLNFFGVDEPQQLDDVRTQIKDIAFRRTPGVNKGISLKQAWSLMQTTNAVTLACVNNEGLLEGIITIGDITQSYMNLYDSSIISKARTKYANILDTLEASMVIGAPEAYFESGKVLIAAANPDMMENYIEKNDLVILGNRYESQLCAIEMEAGCLIVCDGASVSLTIRKLAEERGCAVITTPYDTYTTARLINQSMPIRHFMTTDDIISFSEEDFLEDIHDIMASKRHRDFPVLDAEGRFWGMISRRNLLGARGKPVVLVDHNERSQAVNGIENADIRAIIDHHRLGTIETLSPVFFRNQPVGCTSTIITQMYREAGIEIDRQTAGLLCSAIISDTLLFRSPTCTEIDRSTAIELSKIAEINLDEYARKMFAAASNLKGKTDQEIFYQDFKRFSVGKSLFCIGQITSLDADELDSLKPRIRSYAETAMDYHKVDMMFFMLTDILTESTQLICVGPGAEQLVLNAFHINESSRDIRDGIVDLPGVVSRKKQLVPVLMMALQM